MPEKDKEPVNPFELFLQAIWDCRAELRDCKEKLRSIENWLFLISIKISLLIVAIGLWGVIQS